MNYFLIGIIIGSMIIHYLSIRELKRLLDLLWKNNIDPTKDKK